MIIRVYKPKVKMPMHKKVTACIVLPIIAATTIISVISGDIFGTIDACLYVYILCLWLKMPARESADNGE